VNSRTDSMPTSTDTPFLVVISLGALLSTIGFLLSFLSAPLVLGAKVQVPALVADRMLTNKLLLSQKIFYFHVPVALVSFVALGFGAFFGLRFLSKRQALDDLKSRVGLEVSLAFILMTMASGEMWTRYEWGVWWTWEPRLTTYLVLLLLVFAYFVLRAAIDDPERQAVFASVFAIIAFVDAPISLLVTRLIPSSVHPVIFRSDSGLPPSMLVPFICSLAGICLLAFGLYRYRLFEQGLRIKLDELKNRLND